MLWDSVPQSLDLSLLGGKQAGSKVTAGNWGRCVWAKEWKPAVSGREWGVGLKAKVSTMKPIWPPTSQGASRQRQPCHLLRCKTIFRLGPPEGGPCLPSGWGSLRERLCLPLRLGLPEMAPCVPLRLGSSYMDKSWGYNIQQRDYSQ